MTQEDQNLSKLRDVSDTAWAVAALRATESERPDALFKDPYARRLVGERGAVIIDNMSPGYDMSWFMAVRTTILDEIVLRAIKSHGIDCVVNLACGLDSRSYRLQLPPHIRWFDVDLAGVMTYRKSVLNHDIPSCNVSPRSVDLSIDSERRKFLAEANESGLKVLVITEGLLPYLCEENVVALAADLLASQNVHLWLTDYYSAKTWNQPGNKFMDELVKANISIKFMPAEGVEFFLKHGWKISESRSFVDEGIKLGRTAPKLDFRLEGVASSIDPSLFWEESRILLLTRSSK